MKNNSKIKMVDVGRKKVTTREAVASGKIEMSARTLKFIKDGQVKKGNVLIMAQTAGIMAAKKTAEIIPLCHPLKIDSIDVNCQLDEKKSVINIEAKVKAEEKTGVEMEALTAVVAAALTIYDMCKSIERGITITDICLQRKSGGRSGKYERYNNSR